MRVTGCGGVCYALVSRDGCRQVDPNSEKEDESRVCASHSLPSSPHFLLFLSMTLEKPVHVHVQSNNSINSLCLFRPADPTMMQPLSLRQ